MKGPTLSHILEPPRPDIEAPYSRAQPPIHFQQPADGNHATSFPVSTGHYTQMQSASPPTPSASSSSNIQTPPGSSVAPNVTHATNNNLYACRDCGRSYSRPEHLVRHVQTHTLGRRFLCDICQKSFARKDLLRRHVANHANDSPAKRRRIAADPGPGRVSFACRPCATARVKCDEEKPCRRCVSKNITCVSSEAGSTAAVHLVNLSAKAHTVTEVDDPLPMQMNVSTDLVTPSSTQTAAYKHNDRVPNPTKDVGPTPIAQNTSLRNGQSQLVASATSSATHTHMDPFQQPFDKAPIKDANHVPFFDFLRDVLYEQPPIDPTRFADPQGLAVLDFCNENSLDMTDTDFGLMNFWNMDGQDEKFISQLANTPSRPETANEIAKIRQNLVQVWTESPWRWQPGSEETGWEKLDHLPLSARNTEDIRIRGGDELDKRVSREKLDQAGRDKVLAIMLSTCQPAHTGHRVAASFPSVDVMDSMVHIFLAAHSCLVSGWIHFPTFKLNEQWPEWLAGAAATGAVDTSIRTLNKFGFSVQEAMRINLITRFEYDNRGIQNLGLVQTYVMWEDISLWSGNRRKMEIAECHLSIPITMMRYRGRFQRASYPLIDLRPEDHGEVLESKWRTWVNREQWKRLIFHCYLREGQTSMTTFINPCLSHAELTLPMPEAKQLWFATTAQEWKTHYLQLNAGQTKRPPSVCDIFRDVHLLRANATRLDTQFCVSIYLHGYWALIHEYRQLCAVHRSRSYTTNVGNTTNLLLNSRHQELVKDLQSFHLIASDWNAVTVQEHLVLNLLLMNLHISLDDLQLFSGKEGEDQARRVYPVLQQWVGSTDARSAAWYAGQVLRYAKLFPKNHIKGFFAVAVHHAALALWTYGVIGRANGRQPFAPQNPYENVYLDGPDSLAVQKFIGFEQGRPVITSLERQGKTIECPLHDTRACMNIAQAILKSNASRGKNAMPPIVENLCGLIHKLGDAAWAVGLG